jgi:hypothetical protein
MPFLTADTLTHDIGKDLWTVAAPLKYFSRRLGLLITVPVGTTTDLASIPQALWSIIGNDDPNIVEPATLHDYLYQQQGSLPTGVLKRSQCDTVLRDAMRECGAPYWKRAAVWLGVHLFGGRAWARYRK